MTDQYTTVGGVKKAKTMQTCATTGATRSSREGRGLPSLLPFDAILDLWQLPKETRKYLWGLANREPDFSRETYLRSLECCRRLHFLGMTHLHYHIGQTEYPQYVGISWPAMEDVSKHYESGIQAGYAPRNWEKGMPLSWFLDSFVRHLAAVQRGDKDEEHDRAVMWNAQCLHATALRISRGQLPQGLNDIPGFDMWAELAGVVCPSFPAPESVVYGNEPQNGIDDLDFYI